MAKITLVLDHRSKAKSRKTGLYPIDLRVYHRKYRSVRMNIWTLQKGWDAKKNRLIKSAYVNQDLDCDELNSEIEEKVYKANRLIKELGDDIKKINADELIGLIKERWDHNPDSEIKKRIQNNLSLHTWGNVLIERKIAANEPGTAQWLKNGMDALTKFIGVNDIKLYDITITLLRNFEAHHLSQGNSRNTIAIYLKAIRSIYNSAVDEEMHHTERNPFYNYKMPKSLRTKKRAIAKEDFFKILGLDYPKNSGLWHARNYALIMFYCRGMNFVDLVKLKERNIIGDRLYYGRSKTGGSLSVKITKALKEILDHYIQDKKPNDYLFPANYDGSTKQFQKYKTQRRRMNERLNTMAKDAGIKERFTTYTIRHTWATTAKYLGMPTALISEGLGHTSVTTTETYLKDFENAALDEMNELVIS